MSKVYYSTCSTEQRTQSGRKSATRLRLDRRSTSPVLARLERLDDRVSRCVKVFGRVLVLRGVAAADIDRTSRQRRRSIDASRLDSPRSPARLVSRSDLVEVRTAGFHRSHLLAAHSVSPQSGYG